MLETVGCEDQVDVKRTILNLNKVLAADNLFLKILIDRKSDFSQCGGDAPAIFRTLSWKDINV